jgi:hypothetical protein
MNYITWDIETDNSGGEGLDPRHARIISIAAASWSFSGKQLGSFYSDDMNEKRLIRDFIAWVNFSDSAFMVGWGTSYFDAPFLFRRGEILGLDTGVTLTLNPDDKPKYDPLKSFYGCYEHTICGVRGVDIAYNPGVLDLVAEGRTWSLKPFARSLGFDPIEVDRTALHELGPDELRAYNISDVIVTNEVFRAVC